MKINTSIFDPLRPDRGGSAEKAGNDRGHAAPNSTSAVSPSANRRDSVEISDTARSLAARAAKEEQGQISADRVAELRRKVYEGAYNSLDVVDQVARRILTRGDL